MPYSIEDLEAATIAVGLDDTHQGFIAGIDGEPYPRIHIKPQGTVNAGDGTVPPTPIGGTAGFLTETGKGAGYRIQTDINTIIDGSTLTTAHPGNKVGLQNSVTFRGGFSGENFGGNPDPFVIFGTNDFIQTGSTAGALDGIQEFYGRLTDTHLYTPGAALTYMVATQSEFNIEVSATGATVGTMVGHRIPSAFVHAGTVGAFVGLQVYSATTTGAGAVSGPNYAAQFNGPVQLNGAIVGTPLGGAQAQPVGVYLGVDGTDNPAINMSDSVNTFRLDVIGGELRILKAGVSVAAKFSMAGDLTLSGGLTFNPAVTGSATAGSNGAVPAQVAGYAVVTIAGVAKKIPYFNT